MVDWAQNTNQLSFVLTLLSFVMKQQTEQGRLDSSCCEHGEMGTQQPDARCHKFVVVVFFYCLGGLFISCACGCVIVLVWMGKEGVRVTLVHASCLARSVTDLTVAARPALLAWPFHLNNELFRSPYITTEV